MDAKKFALRMDAVAKTFESNVQDMLIKVALTVHSTVVLGTPIDTGRARGSWLVEIGKPASGTADSPADFGFVAASEKARAKLAAYKRNMGSIHITNNLPYIGPLNDGHSTQAPAGFVEDAVEAGVKRVQGFKLLSKNIGGGGFGGYIVGIGD